MAPVIRERLLSEGLRPEQVENFQQATLRTRELREQIRERAHRLQWRVLDALQARGLSEVHLLGSTGYGYGDTGRELLDEVYADLFGCEAALVRLQFVSGTHAIACGLFGNLRAGDELVSVSGEPYDTLSTVIGQKAPTPGSLIDWGVSYRQLELVDGSLDYQGMRSFLRPDTKMVFLQRSRGYAWRKSLSIEQIGKAIEVIREIAPQCVVMVDNCYGELVEEREPTHVGADLVAGSLIKNLGGTLAATGGYLAGTRAAVDAAAYRLTAPGIGGEQGASLGFSRSMLQGLFQAPIVVGHALEGACWAACFMELEGLEVSPRWEDHRSDIVQAIRLGSPEAQAAFCRGVQRSGPVDSKATPEAWVQPGYRDPILMAGGTFIAGSSLEMSADCPVRPPFIAYLQGGVSLGHVQLGVVRGLVSLQNLTK
ncbi:MAG: methionine gamma-lyase family protein [Candidatus Eremiobacteraeota bacterium]|nr:methionine gamma-lyase family protein [Candidatus Eremiobacteraeota bacterium]